MFKEKIIISGRIDCSNKIFYLRIVKKNIFGTFFLKKNKGWWKQPKWARGGIIEECIFYLEDIETG